MRYLLPIKCELYQRFRKLIHRQKRGAAKNKKVRKSETNSDQSSGSGSSSASGRAVSERLPNVRISQTQPNLSFEAEDESDVEVDHSIAENDPTFVNLKRENDETLEDEELKLENDTAFLNDQLKAENDLAFKNEHRKEENDFDPEKPSTHIGWRANTIIASYKMAIRQGLEGKSSMVIT